MKRIATPVFLAALLAVSVFPASAEEKAGAHQLGKIVVTPSRIPEKALYDLSAEDSLRSTKTVDLITAEDISGSVATNVPELLKSQLGVEVDQYFGNGKSAKVDIRGFGETSLSNVLVMIDGRRTNQIDMSGVDWSQISIDSVERIEILRGSQSVLYGDNAVGGVINIITKKGKGRKPEIGLKYETGSYHYGSYSGFIAGDTPFMNYYASLTANSTDGYRENGDLETVDYTGSLAMHPAEMVDIRFNSGYHKDWFGQPAALRDVQIDGDGPTATRTPNDRAKTLDSYLMPGIDIYGEGAIGKTTLSADFVVRDRRTASLMYNAAIPAWGVTAYWYELNNHIQTFGFTPKFMLESDLASITNRLIAGIDYYSYKDQITSTNFTDTQIGSGTQKDRTIIYEQTLGFYITDSIDIGRRFIVNGGARLESAGYQFDQQAILLNKSSKRDLEYAFDCGLNFKYNERSALYANMARSFRFPAVDEWYQTNMLTTWGAVTGGLNLDLVPQTGMDYELGIRDNSLDWLKLNADYFIIDLRHELYYDPWVTGANAIYDRTLRHGIEVEAHVLPVSMLDIYAKYSQQKAVFVGGSYAGNQIPLVPEAKVAWGLTYTFKDCVSFSYAANFVGPKRFISDQQNVMRRMKQYLTNDIRLSYHKLGFEIYGALNNIFDCEYSEIGSYGQYFPANGRNFVFGVKQKF